MATFALTILAVMCGLGSLSDSFNAPTHSAQVQVLNINWFRKQPNGDDELDNGHLSRSTIYVHLEYKVFLFVDAECKAPQNSLNQVSLWDGIIPSKEHAKFRIQTTNKYHFVDQGSNLPGKEFNLTLHWHVMPLTGKMFADKIVKTGYHLPEDYR